MSGLIIFFAVVFAADYLGRDWGRPFEPLDNDFMSRFTKWDGHEYRAIIESGYDYDPHTAARIAFFSAFPLAAKSLTFVLPPKAALLLDSHGNVLTDGDG